MAERERVDDHPPVYNIYSVRDSGRAGRAGRTTRARAYVHTCAQKYTRARAPVRTPLVKRRWRKGGKEGRKEGGWRFHGLFRAHTSNHVRAFTGFSTDFREPGDFDEWNGETYPRAAGKGEGKKRKRGKKIERVPGDEIVAIGERR